MKDFFRQLFEYNYQVNQMLGRSLLAAGENTLPNSVKLFSHIVNAQGIWTDRINMTNQVYGVWDIHSVEECMEIDRGSFSRAMDILDRFDLDVSVPGLKVKGQPCLKTIGEILFHVINHSTYHRAQIAAEFRQSGLEPLSTDFILWERG